MTTLVVFASITLPIYIYLSIYLSVTTLYYLSLI
jgi:hypothetical protein